MFGKLLTFPHFLMMIICVNSDPYEPFKEQVAICERDKTIDKVKVGNDVMGIPDNIKSIISQNNAQKHIWFDPDNDVNFDNDNLDFYRMSSDGWFVYNCGSVKVACNIKGSGIKTQCVYPKSWFRITYVYYRNEDYLAIRNNWLQNFAGSNDVMAKVMKSSINKQCEAGFDPDSISSDMEVIGVKLQRSTTVDKLCQTWLFSNVILDKYSNLRSSCNLKQEAEALVKEVDFIKITNLIQTVGLQIVKLAEKVPVVGSSLSIVSDSIKLAVTIIKVIQTTAESIRDQKLSPLLRKMFAIKMSNRIILLKQYLGHLCLNVQMAGFNEFKNAFKVLSNGIISMNTDINNQKVKDVDITNSNSVLSKALEAIYSLSEGLDSFESETAKENIKDKLPKFKSNSLLSNIQTMIEN